MSCAQYIRTYACSARTWCIFEDLFVDSEIAAADWSAEETKALVSVGGIEYAIQTWMRYRTLSQACDCHGIFVGGVIILGSVKMTVWMQSMHI